METKRLHCPFEIKGVGEDGIFSGYGSVFGVTDAFSDVVAKGAFTRSLKEASDAGVMPSLLWQHDPTQPIGVWEVMREDARGLYVEGRLALETQQGREAHVLLQMKALNGLSIGFNTVTSELDEKQRTRTLTDVELWEVSIVTFPANGAARITTTKTAPETIREFEAFLRDVGGYSHAAAKAIASGGFKPKADPRDEDELAELAHALSRRGAVFQQPSH